MILKKLAQAIRRQDWFQVVIEVMIVIVGIFIGLQAQALYEEQQDRELEKVYLERLLDDADASIAAQERNLSSDEVRIETIEKVSQLMLNHQVSEDNRQEFSDSFFSSRGFASMDVYLQTIEELVSSGVKGGVKTGHRAVVSPFLAISIHLRVKPSASPSKRASRASVLLFLDPLGRPLGLPDWPGLNLVSDILYFLN